MISLGHVIKKIPGKPVMQFLTLLIALSLAPMALPNGGPAATGNTDCSYALSETTFLASSRGGSGSVNVLTQDNCSWTVVNNTPWIVMISGPNGQGSRAVDFYVQPHSGEPRTGTITIAGLTYTVQQAGTLPCSFSIDPSSQSFGTGGGTGVVNVSATIGCQWGASSGASWVKITGNATGIGSGQVSYTVEANTGEPRIATLLIAGQTFNVVQDGASACNVTIEPSGQSFGTSGGTGAVAVKAPSKCVWAAVSNVTWVTITSGSLGTGDGEVTFLVAENNGPGRTGTLNVSGQLFTITQSGVSSECILSLSPTTKSVRTNGGIGVFNVTAPEDCTYQIQTNRSWIRITTGGIAQGNSVVRFTVTANTTGLRRTGTIFAGNERFVVSQTP
jgi:Putative binding domain, N-terminal/Viral BACON domain